jgi:hypothetical protein
MYTFNVHTRSCGIPWLYGEGLLKDGRPSALYAGNPLAYRFNGLISDAVSVHTHRYAEDDQGGNEKLTG